MDGDSKNIFKNYYRLVVEQAPSEADQNEQLNAQQQVGQKSAVQMQQNPTVGALINAVNTLQGIDDINRQALLKYISQPAFEEGFVATLNKMQGQGPQPSEADLNQKANADQQVGQPSAEDTYSEEEINQFLGQ